MISFVYNTEDPFRYDHLSSMYGCICCNKKLLNMKLIIAFLKFMVFTCIVLNTIKIKHTNNHRHIVLSLHLRFLSCHLLETRFSHQDLGYLVWSNCVQNCHLHFMHAGLAALIASTLSTGEKKDVLLTNSKGSLAYIPAPRRTVHAIQHTMWPHL